MRPNRRFLSALLLLIALLLVATAVPRSSAPERTVAVTFDDLPTTVPGVVANDVASLEEGPRSGSEWVLGRRPVFDLSNSARRAF
jgi:hypothetical protein